MTKPRQPPWDTDINAIDLPAGHPWSDPERWAWARILRGLVADMSDYPGARAEGQDFAAWLAGADDAAGYLASEEKDGALRPWPDTRIISAGFLRLILFQEPYASAPLRPAVRIRSARIDEGLDWAGEHFAGELWLDRCRFNERCIWQGLRVNGLLSIDGSRFEKDLAADRLQAGGLFCREGFVANGAMRLLGAKIGGEASFKGATLQGGLQADGCEVGGDLFCQTDFVSRGEVRLLGAKIGGEVSFIDSTLEGVLQADGIEINGALFLRQMKRLGDAKFIRARIRGNAQIGGSTIEGELDFTGARIEGELLLVFSGGAPSTWGPNARLILRNARLGALAGGAHAFPKRGKRAPPPMDLAGLAYERLGGLLAREGGNLAEDPARTLCAWLKAGHEDLTFTPGPYRTLANALVEAGHANKANDILYEMRRHEAASARPLARFQAFFSDLFIGHGYRAWRAFAWFGVVVLLGAWFGLYASGWRDADVAEVSWDAALRWIGFSLGNAIPLVSLDKAHETFLAAAFGKANDPTSVPVAIAWAFYGQKLLGFIILSYLAAGLSGLASRRKD